ncbi:MAG TPA: adenylate/guanylate cyclase domain-containing protein [Rhizomicrobium sp.]
MTADVERLVTKAERERRNARRLAVILYADGADYTALSNLEEDWTLGALAIARSRFSGAILSRAGRVIATPGDAILAEFASVTEVVLCALDIQRQFSRSPLISPLGNLLQFRIGLHIADVFADGSDILGDGVNIAARITEVAEPGGICMSAGIYEQVRDKLDLLCSDLGDTSLRGIEKHARLYRIDVGAEDDAGPGGRETRPGSVHLVTYRPSVAVLPFAVLGGDGTDDHVADGITDALINALSSSRWFYVIARTSSFRFRTATPNLRDVGRSLGVRYIVDGTFQRVGDEVKITIQLSEAATGRLLKPFEFIERVASAFSMQETIAMRIAAVVEPGVMRSEGGNAMRHASDPGALDHILRAYSRIWELTPDGIAAALPHLQAALAIDDTISQAHSGVALASIIETYMGWAADPLATLKIARDSAAHAIRLDRTDAWAHMALGIVTLQTNEVETSVGLFRAAIKLNPSLAMAYGFLAHAMIFEGRLSEALTLLRMAMRLSPHDPVMYYWLDGMAMADLMSGRFAEALHWARRATQENPAWPGGFRVLAVAHAHLGNREAAAESLARMLELQPNFSLDYIRRIWPFRDAALFDTNLEGLRLAGWNGG